MPPKRILRYCTLRIVRLAHMPEPLARAIACGLTVSFFPLFGVHALMGVALGFLIRANPIIAGASTLLVPPVILPLVFSLDFIVGRKILRFFGFYVQGSETAFMDHTHRGFELVKDADRFLPHFNELYLPALVGALMFMILVWPASYMGAHKLIKVIERRHNLHKANRARLRAEKEQS